MKIVLLFALPWKLHGTVIKPIHLEKEHRTMWIPRLLIKATLYKRPAGAVTGLANNEELTERPDI